jgi:hypothetical protein
MKFLQILLSVFITTLAGCVSISVSSDFDPATDFSNYQTYAWERDESTPSGDPRLDDNPFFDSRVRAGVERQLTAKGLELSSTGNPDMLLHYRIFINTRERVDVRRIPSDDEEVGTRYYSRQFYEEEILLINYDLGTLMINMADSASRTLIWRGWAELDLTDVLNDRDALDERIQAAVEKVINEFPGGQ